MRDRYTGKRLLAVFAHPDDESISMGGTLAKYSQMGVECRLISATRGEWGPISSDSLATRDTLPSVREAELRRACFLLGVSFRGFLGCPDGEVNRVAWDAVESDIVREIRTFKPHVIVTFGPDGLYWNSDHIAIGDITTNAFVSSGDPSRFPEQLGEVLSVYRPAKLYYVHYPDFLMRELVRSIQGGEPVDLWGFGPDDFGIPMEKITTVVDVRQFIPPKMEAIRSHKSQLTADNIFSRVGEETSKELLGFEYFQRTFPAAAVVGNETDLFVGILDQASEEWGIEQLTCRSNSTTKTNPTDKQGVEI